MIEVGARPRSRGGHGRLALILVGAALLGVGIGLLVHRASTVGTAATTAPSTSGLKGQAVWAAGVRPAPPIARLRDQSGRPFSSSSLRGRTVAITFFDSHCNQACPLEGRALAAAERALPAAQRPVLVVVSVNPRDTPASVRAAARRWGLAAAGPWHWLLGREAQLARAWRAYHILVEPTKGDVVHTEALFLVDRHGFERSAYLFPFVARLVSHDLSLLA